MKRLCLFVLSVSLCVCAIEHDFKGFDDNILFGILWPGSLDTPEKLLEGEVKPESKETLNVMTNLKEKYNCQLPNLSQNQTATTADYDGPSPINLLKPLFSQKICSYRLESYWSYEVCHGRYVRQYHEERDGKTVKTQEFFLGTWNDEEQSKLEEKWKVALENKEPPKMSKVEGQTLPYVEMVMELGTKCDLNDKLRLTRVLYVCYSHGRHEVYSFKETSTCEYETIILSPLLCQHPQFKPKDVVENTINCLPVGDAPKKPRNLLKSEVESLKFQNQAIKLMNDDGETHLKFELHPLTDDEAAPEDAQKQLAPPSDAPAPKDDSPVRAFLDGETCLNGGTGWWKYEFCYGKHVMQYHVDRAGEKTTLLLGKFDEQAHLDWNKENRGKAPKPSAKRTSVSHFYSGGDVCDKTGKPRQTEVKLRCPENGSTLPQVSLYLLEPRTCHYILGVESPVICEIVKLADKNGLIKSFSPELSQDKDKGTKEGKGDDESELKKKDPNKLGLD
ncbi:endoplasmic reticulum lectin 1 isoform X2 [Bicyclus anynana]|uniref:Endoplasmic reticulum lectin 1 n=1 Tax=Bicyclus anynana TaxID=110368 RepID=A0A6J1PB99_BICAN|nr:endoplasmic reticulum lectin 1 isoform X2 [Bicyclus anynana]